MIKISTINQAISKNEVQVLDSSIYSGHEKILFCKDTSTNLKAIIAVHSTKLGPGLGGCRMWNYENQNEALNDVLRLSRGMTYKASITGLNLGGGKAVIIGDSKKDKTKELMESFGEFVDSLDGKYITAEDVGMSPSDMKDIRKKLLMLLEHQKKWVEVATHLSLQHTVFIWVSKALLSFVGEMTIWKIKSFYTRCRKSWWISYRLLKKRWL